MRRPPATRRAVREATSLLTATPEEAALLIACATATLGATDLLHLALACRRFSIDRCIEPARPTEEQKADWERRLVANQVQDCAAATAAVVKAVPPDATEAVQHARIEAIIAQREIVQRSRAGKTNVPFAPF
jgi:hypothetical protein